MPVNSEEHHFARAALRHYEDAVFPMDGARLPNAELRRCDALGGDRPAGPTGIWASSLSASASLKGTLETSCWVTQSPPAPWSRRSCTNPSSLSCRLARVKARGGAIRLR